MEIGAIRLSQSKKKLREACLVKLRSLSSEQRVAINNDLQTQLFEQPAWKNAKTIGITVSLKHEWDTWPIIEKAWHQNKQIVVPKCNPVDKSMTFYRIETKDDLEIQYFNLKEPIEARTCKVNKESIDLLIVPGVVFDHKNYRVGHGGGYYDRFLEDFNADTVSLAWHGQIIDQIMIESFDQPVKKLIVAKNIVEIN